MARLTNTTHCPHCGEALPAMTDAFCPQCHEPLDEGPSIPTTPAASNPYESPQSGEAAARGKLSRVLVVFGLLFGSFVFTLLVTPGDPVSVVAVFPPMFGLVFGVYVFSRWIVAECPPRHAPLGWALGLAIIVIGSLLLWLTLSALFRNELIIEPPRPRPAIAVEAD